MSENKPVLIALVVVGLALVGLAVYFFSANEPSPETVTKQVTIPKAKVEPAKVEVPVAAATTPPTGATTNNETPEELAFVLPRLDSSDQLIRDGAVSLTRHEGINRWLGADELIRKIVVFVDNVANGNIAKQPAAALAPRGEISVTKVSDGVYVMTEASYDRYNLVTSILTSIDSKRAVEFYVLLKPLFQQAYDELGYPDAKFDDALIRAIGRMLETPVINEPIKLVRPVVMYEYQDKRLEALSPAQKQMLRMGPKNTLAIQNKLKEFASELRSVLKR